MKLLNVWMVLAGLLLVALPQHVLASACQVCQDQIHYYSPAVVPVEVMDETQSVEDNANFGAGDTSTEKITAHIKTTIQQKYSVSIGSGALAAVLKLLGLQAGYENQNTSEKELTKERTVTGPCKWGHVHVLLYDKVTTADGTCACAVPGCGCTVHVNGTKTEKDNSIQGHSDGGAIQGCQE